MLFVVVFIAVRVLSHHSKRNAEERRTNEEEKAVIAHLQEEEQALRQWYAERLQDASNPELTQWERNTFDRDDSLDPLLPFLPTNGLNWLPDRFTDQKGEPNTDADPLYDEAVRIVTSSGRASISGVQRRLKIGYNRAARLIEEMERVGVVAPSDMRGNCKVLDIEYRTNVAAGRNQKIAAACDRFDLLKKEMDATLDLVLPPKRVMLEAKRIFEKMKHIVGKRWGEKIATLFDKRQYSKFWDTCAEALAEIQRFNTLEHRLDVSLKGIQDAMQKIDNAPAIEGYTRPQFTLPFVTLPDLTADVVSISEQIEKAQSDFEFMSIYEQKRTASKLDEGFSRLTDSINNGFEHLADEMASASEVLSASFDTANQTFMRIESQNAKVLEHQRNTQKLAADTLREQRSTRKIVENQAKKSFG
jgi:hypothetical protein